MLRIPGVDYASHPAFKGLPRSEVWNCCEIERVAEEINGMYDEIIARRLSAAESISCYEKHVLPMLSELARVSSHSVSGDPRTADWFCRSLQPIPQQMLEELLVSTTRSKRPLMRGKLLAEKFGDLEHAGYTQLTLPSGTAKRWFEACAPFRNILSDRARLNVGARQWLALPVMGRITQNIEQQLTSIGALELAASYRGRAMELDHIALHYSHPKQTWYQGCYTDVGLPTSRMAYLHNDYEPSMLKMLIYLSPVAQYDGPFSYVSGSHRWARPMLQHLAFKELDRQHPRSFPECTSAYYRARFALKAERTRLLSLPKSFQGTSHFGDDVLDEVPAFTQLSAAEIPIMGNDTAILFDGGRGLHRGALNQSGERWALQLGFRIKPHRTLIRSAARYGYRVFSKWSDKP